MLSFFRQRTKTIVSGLAVVSASGAFLTTNQGLTPSPTIYLREEVKGRGQRSEVLDPKAEIVFGNIGNGPLYLTELVMLNDNNEPVLLSEVLKSDKWEVSSESSTLLTFKANHPNQKRALEGNAKIPLVTFRPKDKFKDSHDWSDDLVNVLREKGIKLRVKHSWYRLVPYPGSTSEMMIIPKK